MVPISSDILDLFLARVTELSAPRWKRDLEGEASTNEFAARKDIRYVHFLQAPSWRVEVMLLYLDSTLRLVHVVRDQRRVTHEMHEKASSDLWKSGFEQACEEMNLHGVYTPTQEVKPEEGLPPAVAEALYRFAISVNKGDGGTADPEDMELWNRFVIASHVSGTRMEEELLDEYLVAKKFPEEASLSLLHAYEMQLQMLSLYDRMQERRKAAKVQ